MAIHVPSLVILFSAVLVFIVRTHTQSHRQVAAKRFASATVVSITKYCRYS